MDRNEMKSRTKEFAKDIIKLCRKFPNDMEGRLIGNQIFRSGTSTAANYRAACRARSTAMQENNKIIAIIVSSIKTARNNKKQIQNPKSEFHNPKST